MHNGPRKSMAEGSTSQLYCLQLFNRCWYAAPYNVRMRTKNITQGKKLNLLLYLQLRLVPNFQFSALIHNFNYTFSIGI